MSWIGEQYIEYVDSVPKEKEIMKFEEWLTNLDYEKENTQCLEN